FRPLGPERTSSYCRCCPMGADGASLATSELPGRTVREVASARPQGVMAERKDIDFSYTLTDRVIRLALGELADFSGAKYDGDFSLTLEQAQRRKHDYIAEQIGIEPGRRVLDLGCGWGGLLNYIRNRGATGLGVTLSAAQLE